MYRVGARTSHLCSVRKNAPSRLSVNARSARDGGVLSAEPRWERFYAPSENGTFSRAELR